MKKDKLKFDKTVKTKYADSRGTDPDAVKDVAGYSRPTFYPTSQWD